MRPLDKIRGNKGSFEMTRMTQVNTGELRIDVTTTRVRSIRDQVVG